MVEERLILWSRNGNSWITLSMNSTLGLPRTVEQKLNKISPWKRWNPPWENSRTSSKKKKGLWIICNSALFHTEMTTFQLFRYLLLHLKRFLLFFKFMNIEQLWYLSPLLGIAVN